MYLKQLTNMNSVAVNKTLLLINGLRVYYNKTLLMLRCNSCVFYNYANN